MHWSDVHFVQTSLHGVWPASELSALLIQGMTSCYSTSAGRNSLPSSLSNADAVSTSFFLGLHETLCGICGYTTIGL